MESLKTTLSDSFSGIVESVAAHLPHLMAAVAIALVGWVVAAVLRLLTRFLLSRIQSSFDRMKWFQPHVQQVKSYRTAPSFVAAVVFWVVLLLFLAAAVQALEVPAVSDLLSRLTGFLPRVLGAVLIILAGLFFGDVVRNVITRALSGGHSGFGESLGRIAQVLAVVISAIIAIEQLGFDGTVLVTTLAIAFGTLVGGTALAFALGSRTYISNLLAAQHVSKSYSVGDEIRIDGVGGRIVEITQTAFVIRSEDGLVTVPAHRFLETQSLRKDASGQS